MRSIHDPVVTVCVTLDEEWMLEMRPLRTLSKRLVPERLVRREGAVAHEIVLELRDRQSDGLHVLSGMRREPTDMVVDAIISGEDLLRIPVFRFFFP